MLKKAIITLLVTSFIAFWMMICYDVFERVIINIVQKTLRIEAVRKHCNSLEERILKLERGNDHEYSK